MKIACVIHSLDGGGAERVMAGLASRLSRRDHDVTLLTLDDAANDRHPLDPAVIRQPLGLMSHSRGLFEKIRNTRRRIRAVAAAVERVAPDVVLSFCDRTNILVLQALAGRSVPVVIAERSEPARQSLGTYWEYQRRRTYRRATRVIALTNEAAATLQPLSPRTVEVVPSAVDRPPRGSDRKTAADNRQIIAAGRLEHEKGFDRLIEAFAQVAPRHRDWTLRIVGEGSQRQTLERLARQGGVSEQLSMPGWVSPIWPEFAAATMFVLPSRYEGFPSALLEAMAVGVPCVAVDCDSGPRSIINDQIDGLLIPDSVTELAQTIEQMIDQPERRESLGRRAIEVSERFSWDAMVDRYETILREAEENRD